MQRIIAINVRDATIYNLFFKVLSFVLALTLKVVDCGLFSAAARSTLLPLRKNANLQLLG
ncbi:MAG: hypothetical protein H7Y11_03340 [Armatimonadetes bacterium]|nr:hypothetical protein [Anaerolineae bacterium]